MICRVGVMFSPLQYSGPNYQLTIDRWNSAAAHNCSCEHLLGTVCGMEDAVDFM